MAAGLFDMAGRTVLVTGGGQGIGAGIAQVMAEAGARVVIADIDLAQAQAHARTLGEGCGAVRMDLADEDSVVAACAEAVERFGTPWALVNNAGIMDRALLLDSTAAEWDRTLAVNARGPYLTSREIARAMIAAGTGGRIVHVSSTAVQGGITHGHAAYASSKTALLGLTNASALELAAHGITVNLVLPGGVATPGAISAPGPKPEGPACRPPPLGMCGPRDIGAAVLFFALPAAPRVTNQMVAVDAGWTVT